MLMGACTEPGRLQIVTERCKTDLETILYQYDYLLLVSCNSAFFSTETTLYARLKMVKDAAQGMNWLHEITKLVHRDLKPSNLLVQPPLI